MADKKISALTASSTPLAGTEVLPIVQSSSTVQVSVANLTAGRAVATGALTVTGTLTATENVGLGTTTTNISGGGANSEVLTINAKASGNNAILELNGWRATVGEVVSYLRAFNNAAATPIVDLRFVHGGTSTTGYLETYASGTLVTTTSSTALALGVGISLTGGTSGTGYVFSGSAPSNSLALDSSGNFMVGTDNSSGTIGEGFKVLTKRPVTVNAASTDATTTYEAYSTGAGAYRFYVGFGGTIFATSIVISAISDQRLKQNIRNIDTGLDSIMALKPRRFDWKEGKGQDKKNVAGFIAQEFEEVFPECVSTSKAGEDGIEYKNINHETLIPTLVKAIQEQQALITQLTARVAQFESKA